MNLQPLRGRICETKRKRGKVSEMARRRRREDDARFDFFFFFKIIRNIYYVDILKRY